MSNLSWNEIRQRAIQFAHEWQGVTDERAEAQSFWNEFFQVFGIRRRTVASFEEPVNSLKNTKHFIDLFWRGKLLAEHKSKGRSLENASPQAFEYIQELKSGGSKSVSTNAPSRSRVKGKSNAFYSPWVRGTCCPWYFTEAKIKGLSI